MITCRLTRQILKASIEIRWKLFDYENALVIVKYTLNAKNLYRNLLEIFYYKNVLQIILLLKCITVYKLNFLNDCV